MKKRLALALAASFVFGIAGTAFAAANPFVDVPAKHWAYDSVAKLAKAGIVDGYGDGTFRGDKTMSRYEMAQIVAKAMAKSEKADAETKALVDKLAVEFASELNNLGVRVAKLEKNSSNIKFTGQLRERMEYTQDEAKTTEFKTRLRIFMTAPLDDNFKFVGRLGQESKAGDVTGSMNMDQAYVTGQAFGLSEVSLGRMPLYLGKGMIMDSSANWDGLKIGAGNQLKVFAGVARKSYGSWSYVEGKNELDKNKDYDGDGVKSDKEVLVNTTVQDNRTFYFANAAYAFDKNFDMTAAYFNDSGRKGYADTETYKTWVVGAAYKGFKNFTVAGEYAENSADALAGVDAKAWNAKVQYLGANQAKPGTYGVWVKYAKADTGFDPKGYTTSNYTDATATYFDNIKGFEYGFEYTLFKNAVWSANYNPMESNDDKGTDKKFFITNITYNF